MRTRDHADELGRSLAGRRVRSAAANYAMVIGALAAAILLRWWLDPILGESFPFVTLFGAVAFAVWVGGYRPAVVVALLGLFFASYLFIPPRGYMLPANRAQVIGFVAFLFTSGLIIIIGEAARRAIQQARDRRELLRVTLRSIGDAVITTDIDGKVTSLNAVAEALTGWTLPEAVGQPLGTVFRIVNERTRQPVENPATKALRQGVVVGLANHTVLIHKGGSECPIDDSAAPIRDESGRVAGCVLIFRDVTAQRRVEQERANQLHTARLLASIIETSDDAIISKTLDGTIRSWNAGAERLFGHRAEAAIGRHISLIIPPDRLLEETDIVARLTAGEQIAHYETERIRADGQRRVVSLTISPLRDDAGVVIGASKIARDVTEQRRSRERERELHADAVAANAKFQAFFEQGALFAAILDVDGQVLEPNRLFWQGCGFTRDQVVGLPLWQGPWWAPLPHVAERIRAACGQAAHGNRAREEVPYVVADGSERVAVITIQPIDDDRSVRFLALTGADITDRKRAEADRQKFVTLVENSTDFIGMCDLQGVPFFVNRAGLEMVGLDDLDEARRTPVASFFFPEDQARIMEEFFPAVRAKGHGEVEVRFRHFKTGAARWMSYKVLMLPDADGQPVAFATVSQDVTERKRLEDSLRTLAADLSEADRRKNEFLAMLAHELRNPLAPISNAARALRLARSDPQAVHEASAMLERQVGQLGRLVDDLLDMSRISRGKIELRKARVELGSIVNQAVEAAGPLCRSLQHQLAVNVPSRPVYLDGDANRLAQVLGNLLNNACKFTDDGGTISLTVTLEDEHAVIRVRDNGIGIAAEDLPRLFEMFAQVDTSLERSRDGLGIGLTLVKTLVDMHGGSVTAQSEGRGRGAEFTVRLPVAGAAAEPATAPPVTAASSSGRRVLIVDDNDDGAESLALLLRFVGHETYKAHDGWEAIELAALHRPEVMLLDIGLPKLNGYEVCRRIRSEPWGSRIVIVAMTGWGQEEDRHRSREAGFNSHLVKPVDHEALLKLLASLPADNATTSPTA